MKDVLKLPTDLHPLTVSKRGECFLNDESHSIVDTLLELATYFVKNIIYSTVILFCKKSGSLTLNSSCR